MFKKIKNILKAILPPPVKVFNREVERILTGIKSLNSLVSVQTKQLELMGQEIIKLSKKNDELEAKLSKAEEKQEELLEQVAKMNNSVTEAKKHASEAVWAETFNNTISGSTWLHNRSFSPGRWAVGYPVLYVMYRILNETRPKRILELGLGQSTRMIAQYAEANPDVEHTVVEHDPEWISFFENDFSLPINTKMMQLDREFIPYKEADAVRVFKNFNETFSGQTFDFIFVDAPLGGDMKQYSRIDILSLLPHCLADEFVIMIDDFERPGEIRTVGEIKNILKESNIDIASGVYEGNKKGALICSKNMGFLTTM